MNWIRVASDMKSDASIGAIAEACDIGIGPAVGYVVNVFGEMATQSKNGDVGAVPDRTLELWAAWDGKRGVFAKAFRAALCTDTGVVRSWEKHNGAAIRKADQDIERLRDKRRKRTEPSRDDCATIARPSPDHRADVAAMSQVDGDEDGNNTNIQVVVDTPSTAPEPVRQWVAPHGHEALAHLFAAVPDATTWVGVFRGMASGATTGRPVSAARLAVAVQDFVASGKHLEPNGPSPQLFRGFVKRAQEPEVRLAQQSDAEYKAEQLRQIRERNAWCRKALREETPLPAWADQIDAMFPDGRTYPVGVAA